MSNDRRLHRLFVTRHTEYHLRNGECVGVRDLETGRWVWNHAALRLHAIDLPRRGSDHVWLGRRLQFWGRDTDVVTSPVVSVARPSKHCLEHYISLCQAGSIAS
jgi:hypothetical protein